MYILGFAVVSVAVSLASAQTVDPDSVPLSTRQNWCFSQETQCPLLCTQINSGSAEILENDCDPNALTYSCVCSNNMSPNSTEYTQTLPYYECTEYNNQCVANCGAGNNACAQQCLSHSCGASNPRRYNTTMTSSGMTATRTADSSSTPTDDSNFASVNGNDGAAGSGNSMTGGNAAPGLSASMARVYGTAGVLVSVFVGVAVLL